MGGMTRVKAVAKPAANVTALSHPGAVISLVLPEFCRLARRSLGVGLTMLVSSGCIVAEPPTLDAPQKTPPFLFLNEADPSITAIKKVAPDTTVPISVPVRSEDAGDQLFGSLFVDFGSTNELSVDQGLLPPSTLDEKRVISMNWRLRPTDAGCMQLTLLVTHLANLDEGFRPRDSADLALATWWFQVGDVPFASDKCPEPLGTPQ
jgi:hypothetical protein